MVDVHHLFWVYVIDGLMKEVTKFRLVTKNIS